MGALRADREERSTAFALAPPPHPRHGPGCAMPSNSFVEVTSIAAIILHGANNPTLARDTMFAVAMIILNGMVGLSGCWATAARVWCRTIRCKPVARRSADAARKPSSHITETKLLPRGPGLCVKCRPHGANLTRRAEWF